MSSILYQNFDLLIERNGERYRAHVTGSPSGEANTFFDLPDTTNDSHQMIGERLFHLIFSQEVGKCLALSWQKAQLAGTGLRLRLRIDNEASELATLPWELLYSPDWQRFLVLSHKTPLVRYILQTRDDPPLLVKGPLRILVVMSAPKDFPNLQGNRESELLSTALSEFVAQGSVSIEQLHSATLEAVQNRLRKGDVHILHFIGHGYFDEANDEGGLYFEDESGHSCPVCATDLATVLCDATLRLVFLNACEGAVGGQTNFFAGVAQKLVQQQIPAVIAMQYRITDSAALRLSHTFYKALADGYPVDAALTEARKAVFTTGEHPELAEWATAILFSRSPNNQLFAKMETNPRSTSQGQPTTLVTEQTANSENVTNIAGNVNVGRDFVGRDQIVQGDVTEGDKIAGNKIVHNYYASPAEQTVDPVSPLLSAEIERKPFEPETILIPSGCFTMGNDRVMEESPQHEITLPTFRIGKMTVTNRQYAEFIRQTHHPVVPELGWELASIGQRPTLEKESYPVVGMNWDDAIAYCRWLSEVTERSYRLPSEAEWEKAARSSDGRIYPWGNTFDPARCNTKETGKQTLCSANAYSPAGDSPYGIIQMAGNCWEWTNTRWGMQRGLSEYGYPYFASDGREHLEPDVAPYREYRVCRGGSFDSRQERVTCSARGRYPANSHELQCGFRVVLDI